MPHHLWILQCIFPLNNGILLCNYNTTIRIRKLTLIHSYHLILRPLFSFQYWSQQCPLWVQWLVSILCCIWLPCLSSPFLSGNVPWSFLDFYNFDNLENCRSDMFLYVNIGLLWCFLMITLILRVFDKHIGEMLYFSCVPLHGSYCHY